MITECPKCGSKDLLGWMPVAAVYRLEEDGLFHPTGDSDLADDTGTIMCLVCSHFMENIAFDIADD